MPVTVGDFLAIDAPAQGQTFTRSGSLAHAMVGVMGRCYTSNTVSATIAGPNNNSSVTATTQTASSPPPVQGSHGYTWTAGSFALYSPGSYTVSATNGPSDSKTITVN
jgi:hypothetical protein